jgi:hypothetical protein
VGWLGNVNGARHAGSRHARGSTFSRVPGQVVSPADLINGQFDIAQRIHHRIVLFSASLLVVSHSRMQQLSTATDGVTNLAARMHEPRHADSSRAKALRAEPG